MTELNWTEARRSRIVEAIDVEIENSRLSHKVVPEYRLPPTSRTVARNRFDYGAGTIDETHENLDEIFEEFFLTKLQTQDEDLANARLRARRAAQQLAQNEDRSVFRTTIRDTIANSQGAVGIHDIIEVSQPFPDGVVAAVAAAVAALDGEGYRSGFVMISGLDVYTQLHTRAAGAADFPLKAVEGYSRVDRCTGRPCWMARRHSSYR